MTLVANKNPGGKLEYDARHHVVDDEVEVVRSFKTCDCELLLEGTTFEYFDRTLFHALVFLLTIRSRTPVYAPVFSTRSVLTGDVNDWIGDSVQPLVPTYSENAFGPRILNRLDKGWIQKHLIRCVNFIEKPRFQNCMQALNCFPNIPYVNFSLLTALTGLEALFLVSGYQKGRKLGEGVEALTIGHVAKEEVVELYRFRNLIAHGEHTKIKFASDHAIRSFEILCICLERVLETNRFPAPN